MEANQYRTSGTVDESTFQEVSKYALSRRYVRNVRILAAVTAMFGLLMLILRKPFYGVLLVLFAVLIALTPRRLLKSYLKNAVKQLHESHPGGSMVMETWFTQEGVALHNQTTGAHLVLAYETLLRVSETERYFYLVTKANQFTLVFKALLTPEERKSFLPFLQEKSPNLKIVR